MRIPTIITILCAFLLGALPASAQSMGKSSGLPVPRFVSLKSSRVNLRVGPDKKFSVQWLYTKPGLPVEIIQEFEQWRRIRDSQSTEGWVFQSLLSGRRTAIITPWEKEVGPEQLEKFTSAFSSTAANASIVARLQPGVIVKIENCDENWCEIITGKTSGFVQKKQLWGVYPNEEIKG